MRLAGPERSHSYPEGDVQVIAEAAADPPAEKILDGRQQGHASKTPGDSASGMKRESSVAGAKRVMAHPAGQARSGECLAVIAIANNPRAHAQADRQIRWSVAARQGRQQFP